MTKRNQETVRTERHRKRGKQSRYAAKQARGQLYGGTGPNSCCAHRIKLDYWQG